MTLDVLDGQQVSDGAGVRLTRLFGGQDPQRTDPFLLFDAFGSDDPKEYIHGFPWHPHRGIQTVTYLLAGEVEHQDSIGNKGILRAGDLQWMTAGSGILHQEMPRPVDGKMRGLQLWVNLPAASKMTVPRYQNLTGDTIPLVRTDGTTVRIITGSYASTLGAIEGPDGMIYLDISMDKGACLDLSCNSDATSICYLLEGTGTASARPMQRGQLLLAHRCGAITLQADSELRAIFCAGMPLLEPIAWGGPIVMNTVEQLELAFQELREGTFIK